MNKHWRLGGVIRNLSNGLSFSNDDIPDKINRDVVVGISYQREIQNHPNRKSSMRLGLDFNFPFKDGTRANIGGEFWYRQLVGVRFGYIRNIQKRFEPMLNLNTGQITSEERLWTTEGFTYGLGLRLSNLEFNFAYTPQKEPQSKDGEKIRIENGNSIVSFSVSQRF
jgi:hypothetical protein